MGCHGGFKLDDAVRRGWYNPDAILNKIGLRAEMVFMDIGSGEGFFTFLAAKKVGKGGLVYSVDSDPEAIKRLKAKAEDKKLLNVIVKTDIAENTVFCKGCADIVFFSMVLHDFKDPIQVLNNGKKMLKPIGKLVNLDWKKIEIPFGPPISIKFSEQDASRMLRKAGFETKSIEDAGPYHYIITATPVN
jgi:ubiquinone/menaquinone biosynthesis C-methylase UbiE